MVARTQQHQTDDTRTDGAPVDHRFVPPTLPRTSRGSTMSNPPQPDGIEQLDAPDHDSVLRPTDDLYAETCAGWNLAWTQRPAAVVPAVSENDVTRAVEYANARGLSVAVQNTGHGVTVPADEHSVLIATNGLDQVSIDPQAGTATIGGGASWGPVLAAAQEHGLAPLLGSAPHIGAVGYSLGGGFGWLARKHGLAVDTVRSLRRSEEHTSELQSRRHLVCGLLLE